VPDAGWRLSDELRRELSEATGRLGLSDLRWAELDELLGLWGEYGQVLGLIGARNAHELLPHIVEAMQAVAIAIRLELPSGPWLDVGSGGGLPGLVIALHVARDVWLVEPNARKAAFLRLAAARLGLARSVVCRTRLSACGAVQLDAGGPAPVPGTFAAATARAVFPVAEWLAIGQTWVCPGGWVIVHGKEGGCTTQRAPEACLEGEHWSIEAYRATDRTVRRST
jgi:16S rRNA (guanine527-N7)-methyltransferase